MNKMKCLMALSIVFAIGASIYVLAQMNIESMAIAWQPIVAWIAIVAIAIVAVIAEHI
jgi:hypothetical protein